MFESLSQKLSSVFERLKGRGFLNEEDITTALREIRVALLEADVAIPAVKALLAQVKERALGQEILKSVTPGQMIIKFVHEELIRFLGSEPVELNLKANSPFAYLIVGLQGSGKTTTTAKLANRLKNSHKILLASLDIYRPAAQQQLEVLAQMIQVDSLPIVEKEQPLEIVARAFEYARKNGVDLILFDTAGRTHIDNLMMQELNDVYQCVQPIETIFVADAMTGQDAVNIAQSFKETVPLTSLILTRMDGDARGGAVLSTRFITGCPIKFLGVGEQIDKLIPFDARRVADQILDRGDVIQLVEQAAATIDEAKAMKMQKRMAKGQFNMYDMQHQLEQMLKMGGFSSMLKMLPGAKKITAMLDQAGKNKLESSNQTIIRNIAFIQSMTDKERRNPDILNGSRRKRIAAGAGQTVQELNRFLKQFQQLRDLTKKMSRNGGAGLKALLSKTGMEEMFKH